MKDILISSVVKDEMRNPFPDGRRLIEAKLNKYIETNKDQSFMMTLYNSEGNFLCNWPVSCRSAYPWETSERKFIIIQ